MEKGVARQFVCLMADYLDLPSFVCEKMESQLIKGEYEDVINFVVKRKKEIEKKATVYVDMKKQAEEWFEIQKKREEAKGTYKDKQDFIEKHCKMCGSQLCAGPDDEPYAEGCLYLRNATFEENK